MRACWVPWDYEQVRVGQAIRSALRLLNHRDRSLLGLSVAIQMATSFLDLVGVLLIGLVGALAVTTVQSQPPPEVVERIVETLGLADLTNQQLVVALAGTAAVVLLTKSIVSSYLMKRVFTFLANRQALVAARLSKELLAQPLLFVQRRSSQETSYALIGGVSAATNIILAQMVVAASELSLLVVLSIALLFVSPWVAVGAIVFFSAIALGLQFVLGNRANRIGTAGARAEIMSLNAVQEAVASYREATVSNRRSLYVDRIQKLRWEAARLNAQSQWIGMFPRYLFEAALVLGGFALASVLFATQDSIVAVGTLAVFIAAGTRIMPSLLRLQGATITLRSSAGAAGPTFELAEELGHPVDAPQPPEAAHKIKDHIRLGNPDFTPEIVISSVTLVYPESTRPALDSVSMHVRPGESIALVGRSGAGKSTLADVILGVLEPQSGTALLAGLEPSESVIRWPGAIAYVPQDVRLANDTIRANVALGLPSDAIDDDLVWEALERAHMSASVRQRPDGLFAMVGENGLRLSGGQRQRLGIARALYTRPRLLVLDEATSALDAETEQTVADMIRDLGGEVTTIIIAHRLSTVREVDCVYYLSDGRIKASGRFEDVATQVPAFRKQAGLMGLMGDSV